MQASQIGVEQYRQGRGLEPFVCVGEAQRKGAVCFSRFQYEVWWSPMRKAGLDRE
jgi:hypothetical protein